MSFSIGIASAMFACSRRSENICSLKFELFFFLGKKGQVGNMSINKVFIVMILSKSNKSLPQFHYSFKDESKSLKYLTYKSSTSYTFLNGGEC